MDGFPDILQVHTCLAVISKSGNTKEEAFGEGFQMKRLLVPEPVSAGIILSYKCNSECKHCMYACSPKWKDDWISIEDMQEVLTELAARIDKRYPVGFRRIGINYGLHFTGGEPFLNFQLLARGAKMASELKIPATFVETNCFWCVNDEVTRAKLTQLKDAGLNGVLISVNPFILEQVPFERTERAARISADIFGENVVVYQQFFYHQFKMLNFKGSMPFDAYLQKAGTESLDHVELIPMGRAAYELGDLFRKHRAKEFFGESCKEELTRPWHVHVDNYCNYITGYCAGISLGDARKLSSICEEGVDLDENPLIKLLVTDMRELHELAVREFGYTESAGGYVSKCHLCLHLREHIVRQTDEFRELQPKEFYTNLG